MLFLSGLLSVGQEAGHQSCWRQRKWSQYESISSTTAVPLPDSAAVSRAESSTINVHVLAFGICHACFFWFQAWLSLKTLKFSLSISCVSVGVSLSKWGIPEQDISSPAVMVRGLARRAIVGPPPPGNNISGFSQKMLHIQDIRTLRPPIYTGCSFDLARVAMFSTCKNTVWFQR